MEFSKHRVVFNKGFGSTMEDVLLPNEIELFVQTMEPQNIKDIGSERWVDWHNRVQKLNQQAAVEAACLKEEQVKETLVAFGKVKCLVHEVILINIWKNKVLPNMLKLKPDPESTFLAYSILYHEGVCVSLLELVVYHMNCCETLDEASVDLLDYVCGSISQLLNFKHEEQGKQESAKDELFRQRSNLSFEIGIRSLSILRYLAEHFDRLPITVCSHIYTIHDVPILLTEILRIRPWVKGCKQFAGGKWKNWDQEQLVQAEAQVWLTLRFILLDSECSHYYSITQSRRTQLCMLLHLMVPSLLDQLAPLVDLKYWLCKLTSLQEYAAPPKPLLVETIMEIKENILAECKSSWKKIAKQQVGIVFSQNRELLQEVAKKLTDAYNTDLLEQFDVKDAASCKQCGNSAIQRCSRCKTAWYCSRACQVADWPKHKENCP
ncbi:zinc finger MYND domain-containing protein 10 isoform X1 [Dendroctonus ponderosae]|uniref:zinc finger MYND domain-containing protein 10 isoform X1 n=1 Tax=Dendroctonus ponderosae TaxID=77166 RepID=UPI0020361600|nr:zinc finger MYND domain-containing protein 10 isoform X1 [Dendroctonus ponderosae]